jgi:hypothetical protein
VVPFGDTWSRLAIGGAVWRYAVGAVRATRGLGRRDVRPYSAQMRSISTLAWGVQWHSEVGTTVNPTSLSSEISAE